MKGGGKVFDAENSCWHRDDCAQRNVNAMREISILRELLEIFARREMFGAVQAKFMTKTQNTYLFISFRLQKSEIPFCLIAHEHRERQFSFSD